MCWALSYLILTSLGQVLGSPLFRWTDGGSRVICQARTVSRCCSDSLEPGCPAVVGSLTLSLSVLALASGGRSWHGKGANGPFCTVLAIESNTLVEQTELLGGRTHFIQGAGLCPVVLPVLSCVCFSDTRVLSKPSGVETTRKR